MAKKKLAIGVASAVAAGAGAAIFIKEKIRCRISHCFLKKVFPNLPTIGTQSEASMRKTAKESTIPTEIMKRLHVRKNLTELMRNTLTL